MPTIEVTFPHVGLLGVVMVSFFSENRWTSTAEALKGSHAGGKRVKSSSNSSVNSSAKTSSSSLA